MSSWLDKPTWLKVIKQWLLLLFGVIIVGTILSEAWDYIKQIPWFIFGLIIFLFEKVSETLSGTLAQAPLWIIILVLFLLIRTIEKKGR